MAEQARVLLVITKRHQLHDHQARACASLGVINNLNLRDP
jgi:hypothetical protein